MMISFEVNGTALTVRSEDNVVSFRTGEMPPIVRRIQARRLVDAAAALLDDDYECSTEFEFLHEVIDELPHESDRHCVYCGCCDRKACELEDGPCGWHVELESGDPDVMLGVCTNPQCVAKHRRETPVTPQAASG